MALETTTLQYTGTAWCTRKVKSSMRAGCNKGSGSCQPQSLLLVLLFLWTMSQLVVGKSTRHNYRCASPLTLYLSAGSHPLRVACLVRQDKPSFSKYHLPRTKSHANERQASFPPNESCVFQMSGRFNAASLCWLAGWLAEPQVAQLAAQLAHLSACCSRRPGLAKSRETVAPAGVTNEPRILRLY